MDITPLFKACVKTVRTRNKAFGVQNDSDKNRILRNKTKNVFMSKAKDITSQITRLRDFLLDNRNAYLNFSNFLRTGKHMTDAERDQIDNGAQRIINSCSHAIQEFKKDTRKIKSSAQATEFMEVVIKLIESYLKAVCVIQVEQKAIRVKRALDIRKLSKLELEEKRELFDFRIGNGNGSWEDLPSKLNKNISPDEEDKDSSSVTNKHSSELAAELDSSMSTDQYTLSPEELQMFELENTQLYSELNSLSEEVKQIESKVLHIAELQEIFTEKVIMLHKFMLTTILFLHNTLSKYRTELMRTTTN